MAPSVSCFGFFKVELTVSPLDQTRRSFALTKHGLERTWELFEHFHDEYNISESRVVIAPLDCTVTQPDGSWRRFALYIQPAEQSGWQLVPGKRAFLLPPGQWKPDHPGWNPRAKKATIRIDETESSNLEPYLQSYAARLVIQPEIRIEQFGAGTLHLKKMPGLGAMKRVRFSPARAVRVWGYYLLPVPAISSPDVEARKMSFDVQLAIRRTSPLVKIFSRTGLQVTPAMRKGGAATSQSMHLPGNEGHIVASLRPEPALSLTVGPVRQVCLEIRHTKGRCRCFPTS